MKTNLILITILIMIWLSNPSILSSESNLLTSGDEEVIGITMSHSSRDHIRYGEVGEMNEYEGVVFNDVQEWRVLSGREKYLEEESLCIAAEARAKEIGTDWSHNGFYKFAERIMVEKPYEAVGENLSRDFNDPKDVLPAWLQSESHRRNLNKGFNYSCLRCSGHYCALIFGEL